MRAFQRIDEAPGGGDGRLQRAAPHRALDHRLDRARQERHAAFQRTQPCATAVPAARRVPEAREEFRQQLRPVEIEVHPVAEHRQHRGVVTRGGEHLAQCRIDARVDGEQRVAQVVRNHARVPWVARVGEMPELVAGAMAFRKRAMEQVPVFARQQRGCELAFRGNAGQQPLQQRAIAIRCLAVNVAALHRMIAMARAHRVEEFRRIALHVERAIVKAPFDQLHAVEIRHAHGLHGIDGRDAASGAARDRPEVMLRIHLVGTRRPQPRFAGAKLVGHVEMAFAGRRATGADLRPYRARQ